MTRVILAEKPSVARAIASVIGGDQKAEGFIRCDNNTVVTWAYGHLLALASPESYCGGRVEVRDLPLLPAQFKKEPKDKDAAKQLKIISKLLESATEVVHAGDPDREGQLLIDEILHHARWTGPTRRLWLSAVDPTSIRTALAGLRDNADFAHLSESAECRSCADWLVGMNGSIALSRRIQAAGGTEALSIGRVQTPTLALLVRREEEMSGFSKRHYYNVHAHIDGGIRAAWKMPEDTGGLSDDGLLLDKTVAEGVVRRIIGKPAAVTDFMVRQGTRAAPMPHCLSSLQKAASSKYGMSAKATLTAAQALYESGITTYPRSDCQYLPESQHDGAPEILARLRGVIPGAAEADPTLRHAVWNTSKVEAHHAIVPTGREMPTDSTPPDQKKLFSLIAGAYVCLFHPPEKFETREATFNIDGLAFVAKSRTTIDPGWTRLGGDNDDDDQVAGEHDGGSRLPDMTKGNQRICTCGEIEAKETKPPKAYSDGTLIAAMTRVHSLVEDPKLKARLKETSGLGTEATRAGIIETLISRGYAERKGKDIRPSKKGSSLIKTIRAVYPAAADPGTTAVWEDVLAGVAAGKIVPQQFMAAQSDAVKKLTAAILSASSLGDMAPKPSGQVCPSCKSPLVSRKSKKGFEFYTCSGPSCHAAFFQEKDGKPGKKLEKKAA